MPVPDVGGVVPLSCEVVSFLFEGPSGTARIGRVTGGDEAGRLVFLREVPAEAANELAGKVTAASRVAHPSVVKVLGLARAGNALHVASEYIAGASLLQIAEVALQKEAPLEPSVCLRIVHDALVAAVQARRMLELTGQRAVRRTIFFDTIWIVEFGGTLLTEVGVSEALNGRERRRESPPSGDVAAAGAVLRQLVSNRHGHLNVPRAFEGVLAPILARSEMPRMDRFSTPEAMAEALAALPPGCLGLETAVASLVRALMRSERERQRARLSMSEISGADAPTTDATRVFNAQELAQKFERSAERITERPPAPPSARPLDARPSPTEDKSHLRLIDRSQSKTELASTPASTLQSRGGALPLSAMDPADDETRLFVPLFGKTGVEGTGQLPDRWRSRADRTPTHSASAPTPPGDAEPLSFDDTSTLVALRGGQRSGWWIAILLALVVLAVTYAVAFR